MNNFTIVIDIFFILLLTFLFLIKIFEKEKKEKNDWFLLLLTLFSAVTLLVDEYILCVNDEVLNVFIPLKIAVYLRIFFIFICKSLLTSYYFSLSKNRFKIFYFALNTLLVMTIILLLYVNDGSIFTIKNNVYIRNENFYALLLPLTISYLFDFLLISSIKKEKKIYYYLCNLIVLLGLSFQLILRDLAVYIIFSAIIVIILYLKERVDNVKKLADTQLELTNAQIELMLSQIQPHFLFNALSAIGQVCETDSKLAAKSIDDFAFYLRGNIESISNKKLVPFEEELKHIKYYVSLEQLRFQDYLNVIYDIKITDFLVPTLTIEPLVENAIRHGINKKENGGTIIISTKEINKQIIISIKDDGIGFDPNQVDETKHFGLTNVRKRIELISNGSLEINSKLNEGTEVKIILQKGN